MNEEQTLQLLDVVFVVYTTEDDLLDEDESPLVGVRADLDAAMKLAFERLLRDTTQEVNFTVAVLGPFADGRNNFV